MNSSIYIFRKFIELDIVYTAIREKTYSSELVLLKELQENYPTLQLNETTIKALLNVLLEDKHILINEEKEISLNPLSKQFLSYSIDALNNEQQEKRTKIKESLLKIIPISLTCISVLTTLYFGYANLQLNLANTSKDTIINELKDQIRMLKMNDIKIDTIKSPLRIMPQSTK